MTGGRQAKPALKNLCVVDGGLGAGDLVYAFVQPSCNGPLVIRTIATHIAKGGVSGRHEHDSQQMGDKLALHFLGSFETTQYTLEQSHGVPPFSIALDNTTLGDEGSCGYPSFKTVRNIDFEN